MQPPARSILPTGPDGPCPSPSRTWVQAPFSPHQPKRSTFDPVPSCQPATRMDLGIQAPSPVPFSPRWRWRGHLGWWGPPPLGRETPQPAPGRGAGWRLGLGTTGSPSQIPFPRQLQPYRVPSFKGSGSGVLSGAAPALGREASPRSALPAHDRFTWRALVIPAKQGRQNGEINSVEGC